MKYRELVLMPMRYPLLVEPRTGIVQYTVNFTVLSVKLLFLHFW